MEENIVSNIAQTIRKEHGFIAAMTFLAAIDVAKRNWTEADTTRFGSYAKVYLDTLTFPTE